jgi:hypothetical protein
MSVCIVFTKFLVYRHYHPLNIKTHVCYGCRGSNLSHFPLVFFFLTSPSYLISTIWECLSLQIFMWKWRYSSTYFNLGSRLKWGTRFTPAAYLLYLLGWNICGPHNPSRLGGKGKNHLYFSQIRIQIRGYPARKLISLPVPVISLA